MKKKFRILLAAVFVLSSIGIGFLAGYWTEPFSYDQIAGSLTTPPPDAAHTIAILHEGDYPGMSDFPVTAEEAAPGRAAMNALRGQKYTRALAIRKPREGGICLSETSGCSAFYIAYWDGKYLWQSETESGKWLGYVPSDPGKLDETLRSLCK